MSFSKLESNKGLTWSDKRVSFSRNTNSTEFDRRLFARSICLDIGAAIVIAVFFFFFVCAKIDQNRDINRMKEKHYGLCFGDFSKSLLKGFHSQLSKYVLVRVFEI